MKQFSLLLLAMLTSGAALAHGHSAPVDDSMPDAQKIRFCERVRDHAVFDEVLAMDDELRDCIGSGASVLEIRRKVRGKGLRGIGQHGLEKVQAGITTLDEIRALPAVKAAGAEVRAGQAHIAQGRAVGAAADRNDLRLDAAGCHR